jgi:hypothetical protein
MNKGIKISFNARALTVGIYRHAWQLFCLTSMQGYTHIGTVPTLPLKIWDDSGFEEKDESCFVLRSFFYEVFTSDILISIGNIIMFKKSMSTKKKQEADVVKKEPQQLHKKDVVTVDLTNSDDDKEDEPNENTPELLRKARERTKRAMIQLGRERWMPSPELRTRAQKKQKMSIATRDSRTHWEQESETLLGSDSKEGINEEKSSGSLEETQRDEPNIRSVANHPTIDDVGAKEDEEDDRVEFLMNPPKVILSTIEGYRTHPTHGVLASDSGVVEEEKSDANSNDVYDDIQPYIGNSDESHLAASEEEQDVDTSETTEDENVGLALVRSVLPPSFLSFVILFGVYCCFVDPSAVPKLCFCFVLFHSKVADADVVPEKRQAGDRSTHMSFLPRPDSKGWRTLVRSLYAIGFLGTINFAYFVYENVHEKIHIYLSAKNDLFATDFAMSESRI